MGLPRRGCRCFYCQQQRPRWRWALLLLGIVALLSTGVVLAGDGEPELPLGVGLSFFMIGLLVVALAVEFIGWLARRFGSL